RAADVAGHVAAGLELSAAEMPDAVSLVVVTLVVEYDVDHGCLVARLAPERLRTAEAEAAVTDHGDHGLIRSRELHPESGRHSPSEDIWSGPEILLIVSSERHRRLHGAPRIDIAHETSVLLEGCL